MKYTTILFDLDGTLTESGPGIMNSVRYALEQMGREIPDDLERFIGPPLEHSFTSFCGMNSEETAEAIRLYVSRYSETGLFENSVYDGITDMLGRLKNAGLRLAVTTSKFELYAVKIIDKFGLSGYFEGVYGSDRSVGRTEKADVIGYSLEQLGVDDRSTVLMIGDRDYDAIGAHKMGIDCMGILWGYGCREEFEAADAEYIALDPQEAAEMICSE